MKTLAVTIIAVLGAACCGYQYGKSQSRVEIVEKKVEVIKYVAQQKAKILSKPNASRDELLELMRSGKL